MTQKNTENAQHVASDVGHNVQKMSTLNRHTQKALMEKANV